MFSVPPCQNHDNQIIMRNVKLSQQLNSTNDDKTKQNGLI